MYTVLCSDADDAVVDRETIVRRDLSNKIFSFCIPVTYSNHSTFCIRQHGFRLCWDDNGAELSSPSGGRTRRAAESSVPAPLKSRSLGENERR